MGAVAISADGSGRGLGCPRRRGVHQQLSNLAAQRDLTCGRQGHLSEEAVTIGAADFGRTQAEDQLGRLVRDHWQAVYRFMLGMCGERSEAEDLTQSAFTVAFERLDDLREPAKAGAWLFAIAANQARRHRRRLRQAPVQAVEEGRLDVGVDQRLDVQRALAALPPDDREILLLVGYFGFKPPEAGRMLGLADAAAYKRWQRARARFRAGLEGDSA